MIKYQKSLDKTVILTLDMGDSATNIFNHTISNVLRPVIDQLEADVRLGQLKGVIITSAKKRFLEGGKLEYLYQALPAQSQDLYNKIEQLKQLYRRLELLGVPVVAAINGLATGAGYELTLACHHRIALDLPTTLIGLPEVKIGLIPGGGAISRMTWMLGVERALPLITEGRLLRPAQALSAGLVDAIAPDESALIEQARQWIDAHPHAQQPWDARNGQYTLANVKDSQTAQWIAHTTAQMMKRYRKNQPAITAILDIMVNGISLDFDTANKIESRYFTQMVVSPAAKNMMKALWYDTQAIKSGIARPKGFGRFRPRRIGVIGAGQMGSAIAAISALAGMEVVLKDVSKPIAERGKLRAQKVLDKRMDQERISQQEATAAMGRIFPTNAVEEFEQCDLVIEAVFENVAVKTKVIKEAAHYMDEYATFASNTSSLSITRLSKASTQPDNFIGIKFFNPVEDTKIVEIISGKQTSAETVARAIDFARKIKMLPIVIQDRRGFFTTRVMEAYGLEGMMLLQEGCLPSVIEQTALNAGMQLGPLAMMDSISIANTLRFEERKCQIFQPYWYDTGLAVMRQMVNDHNRPGKLSKAGFYDYTGDRPQLWGALTDHFPPSTDACLSANAIWERLLFAQVLEALRCLESKVVGSVPEVNVASIHGWGFAAHKGGALQFINHYGVSAFLERTRELCDRYGRRFAPPQLLIDKAESGENF